MKRGVVTAVLGGTIAVLALGPALALAPVPAADASLGSVPTQVSDYVSSGGLVARLTDVYGKNQAGSGIDFDETTKAVAIDRVYQWTADRLADKTTEHPVQLTNNWVVPITIGAKSVGLATIWINPQTVLPELADFDASASTGTAITAIPADAALVRDSTTHAWLALTGDTVTPLVAGTSGLSTPVPVASLKLSAAPAATASGDPHTGLGLVIGLVALIVVILAVALFITLRRPKPRPRPDADPAPKTAPTVAQVIESAAVATALVDPPTAPVEIVEPEPEPEPAPAPEPEPEPKPAVARAPRAPRPKAATPVTKPTASKPAAAASAKPRVQKPPVQKPPVQKPPVQKPPVQKPPVQKPPAPRTPRAPKPPTDPDSGPAA